MGNIAKNTQKKLQFDNFIWIDICQPNKENLDKIAEEYDLDYFQVKDSLEHGHLPKFEKLPQYNFLILRAFTSNLKQNATTITELSNKIAFFYNKEKLLTVHRIPFKFLELEKREWTDSEEIILFLIRKMVDTYQPPLDVLDDKITQIEKTIFLKDYSRISLEDLYYLKIQTRITKKLLQIFQNVVHQLDVADQYKTALQDIKDSLLNLILNYEEIIENSNNLMNTYLNVNAQKSNDVMKLLTIFSAFFLPLTFVAGIYGMNFENMPELKWPLGYFFAIGLMAVIALVIYFWFKRKKIL